MAKAASPVVAPKGEAPTTKGGKPKVAATPNVKLVELFQNYDENVEKAESSYIELIEFVQKHDLDRETVVVSIMKARDITYESAQGVFTRMKKIFHNEEVLAKLKDGTMNMRMAVAAVTKKQANPASKKPEAIEQRFNNALKNFGQAAKESGHSLKELLLSVEAELKSLEIK